MPALDWSEALEPAASHQASLPLVEQAASRRQATPKLSQHYTKVAQILSGIPHSTQYCMVRWKAMSSPSSRCQRSRWQPLRTGQMIPFNIYLRVPRWRFVFPGGSDSKITRWIHSRGGSGTYQSVPCLSIVPHHPTPRLSCPHSPNARSHHHR